MTSKIHVGDAFLAALNRQPQSGGRSAAAAEVVARLGYLVRLSSPVTHPDRLPVNGVSPPTSDI